MNKKFKTMISVILIIFCGWVSAGQTPEAVIESQRQIPVVWQGDVIVVGGTTGACTAAIEAAANGADVFLVSSRTYVGVDMCSTYRLYLESGEKPQSNLEKMLFAQPEKIRGLDFTYTTSIPSQGKHEDTEPPFMLNDRNWTSAITESVEFADDTTVSIDLKKPQRLSKISVFSFQNSPNCAVKQVEVFARTDKNDDWNKIAVINVESDQLKSGLRKPAQELSAKINGEYRYIKCNIKKYEESSRILLGEILIETEDQTVAATKQFVPRPMHVKSTLENALIDAGVNFLFSSFPVDVLVNTDNEISGVVIANRSGRQVLVAKNVIDATMRSSVARIAGAEFDPFPSGPQTFKRVVLGGEPVEGEKGITSRKFPAPQWQPALKNNKSSKIAWEVGPPEDWDHTCIEYELKIDMPDGSFDSFARAEQIARSKTFSLDQFDASQFLFNVPPDPIIARESVIDWPGAENIDLNVFRPKKFDNIYILNGCADISRKAAERFLRPLAYMRIGKRIGKMAAEQSKTEKKPTLASLKVLSEKPDRKEDIVSGRVKEMLRGLRSTQENLPVVQSPKRKLPILGSYDVVVVGGGTGGAPAGISAARHGARTLVIEYLDKLGGVSTSGLIGIYYFGNLNGFTAEIDNAIRNMGPKALEPKSDGTGVWNIEYRTEWLRKELRKAGGDLWFGTLGCGAFVEDGKIKGVVVATPHGRGIVLADVVIDSTGSSDIAIAAGADYMFTDAENAALQGTGLSFRNIYTIGKHQIRWYANTDYTFVDDTDMLDVWRAFVGARKKYKNHYDLAYLINTRERRRIVGEFTVSPVDILTGRTYDDSIVLSRSNFDSHGFTIHPVFMLHAPDKSIKLAYTPYRSLLPKGLEGIMVTGLGISAHRDAMPILRMQPCIQNQGYATGLIASTAAKESIPLRKINIDEIQVKLVEKGCLPPEVLTHKDSFPLSQDRLEQAVNNVKDEWQDLPFVLSQPQDTIPLIKKSYANSDVFEHKLIFAQILGMLGDDTGSETLIEHIEKMPWDEGWNFRGGGQYGGSLSRLDCEIISLGKSGDDSRMDVLVEKIEQLTPHEEFSHFRAVAIAAEELANTAAAKPLADLLKKPGMTGYTITKANLTSQQFKFTTNRSLSLREIILARALYKCGDHEGLGEKILRSYEEDLRGHYARHAHAVLQQD